MKDKTDKTNNMILGILLVSGVLAVLILSLNLITIYKHNESYQNKIIDKVHISNNCDQLFRMGIDYAYKQNIFYENKVTPEIIKKMTELNCK